MSSWTKRDLSRDLEHATNHICSAPVASSFDISTNKRFKKKTSKLPWGSSVAADDLSWEQTEDWNLFLCVTASIKQRGSLEGVREFISHHLYILRGFNTFKQHQNWTHLTTSCSWECLSVSHHHIQCVTGAMNPNHRPCRCCSKSSPDVATAASDISS